MFAQLVLPVVERYCQVGDADGHGLGLGLRIFTGQRGVGVATWVLLVVECYC